MSIGHSTAPPSPQTIPARTCGSPIRASSAMYTMSQNSASVAPMPIASPFTAAIIGWRTARMFRVVATASISSPGWPSGYDSFSFITEKSAPTVKYLPAPVSTITSTSSSAARFW